MKSFRHIFCGSSMMILGICCVLLLSLSAVTFAEKKHKQSELELFEEDFEENGKKQSTKERDDKNARSRAFGEEDDDSFFLSLLWEVLEYMITTAWAQPHPELWRFQAYPYSAGGAFSYRADLGKRYFIVPGVTYHHLSSGLNGIVADADLRLWSEWGMQGQYKRYVEKLFAGHQELDFASAAFTYTIIQTPSFYLEAGLGSKGLKGKGKCWKGGPNAGLWTKIFPMMPLVLSFGVEAASIHGAPLSEWSAGVGLMRNNLEFKVGYRSLYSEHHTLHGLEMGAGIWF